MRTAPRSSSPDDPVDQFNLSVRFANGKAPTVAVHWLSRATPRPNTTLVSVKRPASAFRRTINSRLVGIARRHNRGMQRLNP